MDIRLLTTKTYLPLGVARSNTSRNGQITDLTRSNKSTRSGSIWVSKRRQGSFVPDGLRKGLAVCRAENGNGNGNVLLENGGKKTTPDELSKGIVLPQKSSGRKRKILFLLATGAMELYATGVLLWAPLVSALAFVFFTPSSKEIQQRDEDLVERAHKKAILEYWKKVPSTPLESAEWLNRILQGLWKGYVEQFVVVNNVGLWQEKLADACPNGWDVRIENFDMGDTAPTITGFRIFNDTQSGRFSALDAAVEFDTTSLSVELDGTGPVGNFVVSISGVRLRGDIRVLPCFEHRMLLFSFKEAPKLDLNLSVKGPAIGAVDIPQFDFLKKAIRTVLADLFVEPRRGCISLDYEPIGKLAVDAVCRMQIVGIRGLTPPEKSSNGSKPLESIKFSVLNMATKVQRETSAIPLTGSKAECGETLPVGLGDSGGILKVNVLNAVENGKKAKPLGSVRMNISHLGDGCTGFWTMDNDWRPLACRWLGNSDPWIVEVPLENMPDAVMTLRLSMGDWTYRQPLPPLVYRSTGERTVIMQVVEARDLIAKDMDGTSDPYVCAMYNNRKHTTNVQFRCLDPIWGDVFVFAENSSLLSKKVRLDVWDKDTRFGDDREGFFFVNLDLVTEGKYVDRWFQVAGEASGEVRVRFTVIAGTLKSSKVQEAAKKLKSERIPASVPSISVRVTSAKDLLPMDANQKSDPFCVIRYGDFETSTPVIPKTLNPTWDFVAHFPYNPKVNKVRIDCFDQDALGKRDFEGFVELDIQEHTSIEGSIWQDWLPLQNTKKGSINVGLSRNPATEQFVPGDSMAFKKSEGESVTSSVTAGGESGDQSDEEGGVSKQWQGFVKGVQRFLSD